MMYRARTHAYGAAVSLALLALAPRADAQAEAPPTDAAIHPSDVLAEVTGSGPGVSRAVARVIRTTENAIPVIATANVRAVPGGDSIFLVGYQISANEACVRARAPEGRAALRAAREACRTVRGIKSLLAAVRCSRAPGGADACASSEMLWKASIAGGRERPGRVRDYTETISSIRITEQNVDADAETEIVVDYRHDESYWDPADMRGGGGVEEAYHEAIVIDADGAVLARAVIANGEQQEDALAEASVHARIEGRTVRFAASATCEIGQRGCSLEWSEPFALAPEPAVHPAAVAVPTAPAAGG